MIVQTNEIYSQQSRPQQNQQFVVQSIEQSQ
jgi:hypothetical protein